MSRPIPALLLVLPLLSVIFGAPPRAQLVSGEGFAYPVGGTLAGQAGGAGWLAPWSQVQGAAAQGELQPGFSWTDAGGLALPEAGAARLRLVGGSAARPIDAAAAPPGLAGGGAVGVPGAAVWLAFLGRCESAATGPGAGAGVSLFAGGTERLFVGREGDENRWAIRSNVFGSDAVTGEPADVLSLVVLRLDFDAGTAVASLWIDPPLGAEPAPGSEDVLLFAGPVSFDEVRATSGADNVLNLDELRIGGSFAAAVGLAGGANQAPLQPVIQEPAVDGQMVNPFDVHMEAAPFQDPDAGDAHVCSDWEIYLPLPIERVWRASCAGGPAGVHIHLGDGVFEGSHAGATNLMADTSYLLRTRHRDSSNDPYSEWSPWAYRGFETGASSAQFPLQIEDVLPLPPPRWELADGGAPVVLPPGGAALALESAPGGLMLELAGLDGFQNLAQNPAALTGHEGARLRLRAGPGAPLSLAASDLVVRDEHCLEHRLLLPAVSLAAGEEAQWWVGSDGATYVASPAQLLPFLTEPARLADPPWAARMEGFAVETFATGLALPVHLAFVPNPGPAPGDPFLYATELYGSIAVVTRDGTVHDYATGLLDFNPTGVFPGSGEQGLAGIAVDPATGDVFASMVRDGGGGQLFPKVDRFTSADGGLTAATRTTILDLVGEAQGPSHQISNLAITPDRKLLVHVGDGFVATTALDPLSYRGKILRVELDGSPVTTNPFHDPADGIDARDFTWALGLRNPFGGDLRAADGFLYEVENGPITDRLARITPALNLGWDGTDGSMSNFALFNWFPAVGPVELAFVQPESFGGSGFPPEKLGRAYVTLSGPTYATGPQASSKRVVEFTLDALGAPTGPPETLVEYTGTGKSTAAGLAAGPDGLYFTTLYADDPAAAPGDPGASILRVRWVGFPDCNANGVEDGCDVAAGTSLDLDQDGVPDECAAPPLSADVLSLSLASGGAQSLFLDAGPGPCGPVYLVLGSVSGTAPAAVVDGLLLPLVPDPYLIATVDAAGGPILVNTFGLLSPAGTAQAAVVLPPGLPALLAGHTLHHAALVFDPLSFPGSPFACFASNAVPLALTP